MRNIVQYVEEMILKEWAGCEEAITGHGRWGAFVPQPEGTEEVESY